MAKSELIGHRACPLCKGRARVGLMTTGCVILTCDGCNIQLFTRSGKSDQLVRDLPPAPDGQEKPPVPAPTPAPAPRTAPPPVATTEKPAEKEAAPVRTEKRSVFGFLEV